MTPEEVNDPKIVKKKLRDDIALKFEFYNTEKCDKLKELRSNLEDVREQLISNLEKVLDRGEQIEVLVEKTESMVDLSNELKVNSKTLKKIMWWKNSKLWILCILVVIFVIYFIMVYFCGGFLL